MDREGCEERPEEEEVKSGREEEVEQDRKSNLTWLDLDGILEFHQAQIVSSASYFYRKILLICAVIFTFFNAHLNFKEMGFFLRSKNKNYTDEV